MLATAPVVDTVTERFDGTLAELVACQPSWLKGQSLEMNYILMILEELDQKNIMTLYK